MLITSATALVNELGGDWCFISLPLSVIMGENALSRLRDIDSFFFHLFLLVGG